MKKKEDCRWCLATQHIKRDVPEHMPIEYEYRCSACHEQFYEEEREEVLDMFTIFNKLGLGV